MWNHLLRYNGLGYDGVKYENWNVDSAGVPTLSTSGELWWTWPIYDPKKTGTLSAAESYWQAKVIYSGPSRRAGEGLVLWDAVNPLKQGRRAWQYLPGQRRVKLAPDLAYDTPNPATAGASTWDDLSVFNGAMDRYNWKLVGKKEMIIPYGGYNVTYHKPTADVTKPNHINPDLVRWELHRVWVVEATLKEGARHVYHKRIFYLDEDSWLGVCLRSVRRARSALPVELRVLVVQLRRSSAVRRHHGDLRLQLRAVCGQRPVRDVQRAQVHDRTAEGNRDVGGSVGRLGRTLSGLSAVMLSRSAGAAPNRRRAGKVDPLSES